MCEYARQTEPVKVKNVADNKTLMDQCIKHLEYNDLYPNAVMDSERDASEEAFREATGHPLEAEFEWVWGHQDDDESLDKLSMESRLNILADKLA